MVTCNGIDYAYIYNVQGDVIALVDSTGAKVVEYYYDAWGKVLSKTGTLATTLGTLNPFRYRGYVFDEETGLYYLRSRYYNPNRCRFVNGDALLASVGSLANRNSYAYCDNNAINCKDDNGKAGLSIALLCGIGSSKLAEILLGATAALYVADTWQRTMQALHQQSSQARIKEIASQYAVRSVENDLSAIARRYKILECSLAAAAMAEYLRDHNEEAMVIEIYNEVRGGIVSDTWGPNEAISTTGYHVGIEYKGRVYCNVHPGGLPTEEWLHDFHGRSSLWHVERTPVSEFHGQRIREGMQYESYWQ